MDFSEDRIAELASLADGRKALLLGEASHGTSEYYRIREGIIAAARAGNQRDDAGDG